MASNLTFIRGTDQSIDVEVTEDGEVLDITGSTIHFTAKSNLDNEDSEAEISITVTDHTDPEHGLSIINLSHTDLAVEPGNYYYDIEIIDSDGKIISTRPGILTIVADVRNDAE